jgi:hypothetical protein
MFRQLLPRRSPSVNGICLVPYITPLGDIRLLSLEYAGRHVSFLLIFVRFSLQSGFSPSEIVRDPERGCAFSQLDARTGSDGIPFLVPKAKSKDYSERLS